MRLKTAAMLAPLLLFAGISACPQTTNQTANQTATPPATPVIKAPEPASGAAAAKTPPDYTAESYIIQKYSTDITYAPDGTGERLLTVQVKIQSDAAVRQFGVLEFPYESRNEHLDFVYVRVHKADGSVVATPDTDAQDQPAEVTRQAPFYSDIRNKQLPVKSLSVGDQLEYQVRQVRTVAAAPGHFWYTQNFIKDAVVLEETESLNVPKQKYLQVNSSDLKPTITEEGERRIYRWKTSQLDKSKPADSKPKKQPIVESPPSIAITTFKDWAEVGRWYGDLQKDRVTVTPTVQAKANELTRGMATDEEKIAALYTYVSTQYRYIGVAFGIGRYQPHSADDVMQNQYGDCKDKHTLLASLLKAAGYDAWPVMVGSQHVLQPDVPSPGQFDHVITAVTLNQRVLWMDSTPEVAPYRLLFYGLRDKQVLGIPNNSTPALMKTPSDPPFDPLDTYTAKATLTGDGTLSGRFDLSLRGDSELLYRIGFHQTPRVQWNTLVQNVSYSSGFAGTTSNVTAGSPEKLDVPFQISYDYTRKKFADWDNHRILPLMPPIAFSYGEDDDKPTDTITLGGPVNYRFSTVILLPKEYRAELPAAVNLHTSFGDYATTYAQSDGNLTIERKIHLGPREIPAAQWDEYLKFEKAVVADESNYIQLVGVDGGNSLALGTVDASDAPGLVQQAFNYLKAGKVDWARKSLDAAAKVSPKEIGLWAGYAYADTIEHNDDEAVANYRKELEYNPTNLGIYLSLAGVQMRLQDPEDAIRTLNALVKASPNYKGAQAQLGSAQLRSRHFADASSSLEKASLQDPANQNLKVLLATALISSGEKDRGAKLLREILQGATEESLLNDASYALADADLDLPLATTSCAKALDLLGAASEKISLASVTDQDLKLTVDFAAAWDTMAWILYRKGEYTRAEEFARAAWALDPSPLAGTHLGDIYAMQGKQTEATLAYRMAIISGHETISAEVNDARVRLQKLFAPGQKPTENESSDLQIAAQKLADSRVTHVAVQDKKTGAAAFFVLLSSAGIEGVEFQSGDGAFKPYASIVGKAAMAFPFPDNAKVKLLRRGTLFCSDFLPDCVFTMLSSTNTTQN